MTPKKSLVIAFLIPILLVILVLISIWLPRFLVHPTQDFIYSVGDEYSSSYYYVVQGEQIVRQEVNLPKEQIYRVPASGQIEPALYYYDVETNESRMLTLDEAQVYQISPQPVSDDGYQIVRGAEYFPFDGNNQDSLYIKGHSFSKRLNVVLGNTGYYTPFRFLGWVK